MITDAEILATAEPQLREDEGVRYAAYLDTKGIPTIGIGHTDKSIHLGLIWTEAQVASAFAQDLAIVLKGLDTAIPWWRGLSAVRASVLVNITFNVGVHGLLQFKKMLAACERGDWDQAGLEIYNSQLSVNRRVRLQQQMQTGVL
jgi:lysozyme